MIYNDSKNKSITTVEFGHGSVRINPTNNPETMVANGVLLYCDGMCRPIGCKDDSSIGADIRTKDNSVFLYFTKVESIDVLLEELNIVKRGMIEQKSVQQVLLAEGCE